MFSNDLMIPKNFVGLDKYKTKTNPQTTQFCDKLCVDDPLALVLGQWSRSSLSQNDPETDSTFSSFINSTMCLNNEDELKDNSSEKLCMPLLVLPEPKNTTLTDTDENILLDTTSNIITPTSSIDELQSQNSNAKNDQPESKY